MGSMNEIHMFKHRSENRLSASVCRLDYLLLKLQAFTKV